MNCFLSENWDLRLSTIWNMRWASWKARWALIFWMATPPQTRRLPGRNREYHCKGYRAQPIHALLLGGSFGSSPALKFQGQALPSSRPIKSMLLILEARQESGAVVVSQGLAHRKETTEFSQENRWPKGADVALWSDEFHPFSNANAIAFYGDGISWSIPIEVVRSPQSLVEAKVSTLECTRSSIHKGSACLCIFGIHLAIGLGFIVFKAVSFDLPNLFKLDAQALVRCGHWDRIWILSGKQQWRIWDSSVTVAGLRQRCGICIDMQAYPEYIYICILFFGNHWNHPLSRPFVSATGPARISATLRTWSHVWQCDITTPDLENFFAFVPALATAPRFGESIGKDFCHGAPGSPGQSSAGPEDRHHDGTELHGHHLHRHFPGVPLGSQAPASLRICSGRENVFFDQFIIIHHNSS